MTDIFDEVREDLRAERAQFLLRRYAGLLVAVAVLIVAGAGAWKWWEYHQAQTNGATAAIFLEAMAKSQPPQGAGDTRLATPATAEATTGFAQVAASGSDGYRTLARLRQAALEVNAGNTPAALALWDQIGADTKADPLLRDLAALLWAQNQVDAGTPSDVESHLAPLVVTGSPWRPLAVEQQALLALRTGNDPRARELLRQLAADPTAPDGVRGRAGGLLTRLGEAAPAAPEIGG